MTHFGYRKGGGTRHRHDPQTVAQIGDFAKNAKSWGVQYLLMQSENLVYVLGIGILHYSFELKSGQLQAGQFGLTGTDQKAVAGSGVSLP